MSEKYRKGVFLLVYSKTKKGIEYLLLKRKLHWKGWEFPKGGIEKGEDLLKALKREIKEETNISDKGILMIKKFNFSGKYDYDKELPDRKGIKGQTFEGLYAIRVKKQKISLDKKEHSGYEWVNYKSALDRLTWDDQKKALKKVHAWLKKMKFREKELDSGKIVLMGKNDSQNEKLVKEFIGKENIIMHTIASGSPFCIALEKLSKITKEEKKQMANLCAAYSQDWRDNRNDIKVNVFTGKDVYKKEKMKIGTFGVKNPKVIIAKKKDINKIKK